jgi:hypothetical protein
MAEKIDHDDEEKDEKDEAAEAEEAKEKAALADEKAAAADEAAEKDDADGEGEDEGENEDDEEEEEAKPAPKPVVTKAAAAKPVVAKRVAAPLAKTRPAPARKGGSLGKSMILFVVIVAGLAAAFALLGQESSTGPAAPKWKTGDTPELEITLIADDKKNLACAAPDEIEGKHCAFEAQAKPWSKGDSTDDKKLLKPYTTVDHVQVLAAGLWTDPALTGTLPTTRFSVKCKFKVEGKVKTTSMRWAIDGGWNDVKDLYTGSISGCKLVQ